MSTPALVSDPAGPLNSVRRGMLRRTLRERPQLLVALVILLGFVTVAVLAPVIQPESPRVKSGGVYEMPGAAHLLGTDDGGVDMLSLLIEGTLVSLVVGFAAAFVAVVIGGVIGILSGFFGGRLDLVLMRITDYFIVIPSVPAMIVASALFGRSLGIIVLIIAILSWTFTARIIRSQVISLRERVYVKRARAIGASNLRLITRHILPQVAPLLVANAVLLVSSAIFSETFIAFLGLGDPNVISWGRLIGNAFRGNAVLNDAWWAIVPPGVCVALVVLACTMIGQSLEESLNPRLRSGFVSPHRFRIRPLTGQEQV